MFPDINFNDDYSNEYTLLLIKAIEEARNLQFDSVPKSNFTLPIGDDELNAAELLILKKLYPLLAKKMPFYWGNSCQLLSSHIFGFLNAVGIPAEIIIGEVRVHGTLEFDTDLNQLREDYKKPDMSKGQMLHAWVSIGGDTIIDAGLSHRMVKYYGLPERLAAPILIGRASDLSKTLFVRHQPMIAGSEYLGRTTNPAPSTLIDFYKSFL